MKNKSTNPKSKEKKELIKGLNELIKQGIVYCPKPGQYRLTKYKEEK